LDCEDDHDGDTEGLEPQLVASEVAIDSVNDFVGLMTHMVSMTGTPLTEVTLVTGAAHWTVEGLVGSLVRRGTPFSQALSWLSAWATCRLRHVIKRDWVPD